MKPVVSAGNAWVCIILSILAIVILSILGGLFKSNHPSLTGSTEQPADGGAVAFNIFMAVVVYAAFVVFCGCQAWLHKREGRRGEISLN